MADELKSKIIAFLIRVLHDSDDLEFVDLDLVDLKQIAILHLIYKEYESIKDLTIKQVIEELEPLIKEIWDAYEEVKHDNNI